MRTFLDRAGEEWVIPTLTLLKVTEIENYDFQGQYQKITLIPPEQDLFEKHLTNARVCFGIVWVLVREQAKNRKWKNPDFDPKAPSTLQSSQEYIHCHNEDDFANRLDGSSLQRMKEALWEELPDFFTEARTSLKALTSKYTRINQLAEKRLAEVLEEKLPDSRLQEEVDRVINDAVKNLDGPGMRSS